MISEDHGDIRRVELGSELLVEWHTMSGNFHGVNSGDSLLPVVDSVIEELVGLGSKVKTVLGEFVVDFGELAPV